jgi:hypothetical protein
VKKILFSPLFLLLISMQAQASEKLDKIVARLEGTYEMIEWDDAGKKLFPPAVSARYVIRDGSIMWIAHKNADGKRSSNAHYGSYTLTETSFAYGYGNWLEVNVEGDETTASWDPKPEMKSLTLPAMRSYSLSFENNLLRASAGNIYLEFREDGFDFVNKASGFIRKYRRVTK